MVELAYRFAASIRHIENATARGGTMSAELAATFFNMGYAQSVAQSMEKNRVDVLVLTQGQYMGILQDKARNNPALEFNLRKILASSTFGSTGSTPSAPTPASRGSAPRRREPTTRSPSPAR